MDDLVKGGLEIPCVHVFEGDEKATAKAKKFVELANLLAKKRKVTDIPTIVPHISEDSTSQEWIQFSRGLVLSIADKKRILAGEKLDDRHIDLAQNMLKNNFQTLEDSSQLCYRQRPRGSI